ncbi:MAG: deoxyguanosinetriphosphate triphosphohydrolase [Alphaproteobacteria bacterium]
MNTDPPAPFENLGLASYACRSSDSRGRLIEEPAAKNRSAFQRDRDRIIHSNAFRRLKHKTQVFVFHEGDYFRTRLTHSIEVAQIARTITRSLRGNEDLAEAVALAHDLGHTPFGHAGEDALSAALLDAGGFDHNVQTLRILTRLEHRYAAFDGLNLTWETLEGVVKHNGPVVDPADPIRAYDAEHPLWLDSYAGLESQIASLADDIAYNTHDIDDGLRAGLFTLEAVAELPLLGSILAQIDKDWPDLERQRRIYELVRELIGALVNDLTAETSRRLENLNPATADDIRRAASPVATFSDEMATVLETLRGFLKTHMYRHTQVNRMTSKARRIVSDLFDLLVKEPQSLPAEWRALAEGKESARIKRVVGDYIAGMTDRYAMLEHQRLFDIYSRSL